MESYSAMNHARDVLRECGDRFKDYFDTHIAKGAEEKAQRNLEMSIKAHAAADHISAALTRTPPPPSGDAVRLAIKALEIADIAPIPQSPISEVILLRKVIDKALSALRALPATPVNPPSAERGEALASWKDFYNLCCEFGRDINAYADAVADLLDHDETIRAALSAPVTEFELDCRADKTGLDDGPEFPRHYYIASVKPRIIKAWQEGLSTRQVGKIFDVSHETVAQIVKFHKRDAAPVTDTGWMPIETAPRDWTKVIVYVPEYDEPCVDDMGTWHEEQVTTAYYSMADGGKDCWIENRAPMPVQPTHWRPLPAPPVKQKLYGRG